MYKLTYSKWSRLHSCHCHFLYTYKINREIEDGKTGLFCCFQDHSHHCNHPCHPLRNWYITLFPSLDLLANSVVQGLAVQRRQLHLFRPQQSFVRSRRKTNREQRPWEMLLFRVTKIPSSHEYEWMHALCTKYVVLGWLFLIEIKKNGNWARNLQH